MELYYFPASPPCRAVLLFLHAISLKPTMKIIDISAKENLTPEYKKLNPQQTIPLIVDDGFVLSESRAILGYLADQYGKNGSHYPSDPKARGVVNQRLMFDIGTMYQRFLDVYAEPLKSESPVALNEGKLKKLAEAFEVLEVFMGDSHWMAGDQITIADYSLVASITTIEACGFDISKYTKVTAWLDRCKKEMIDYEETNQVGANLLGEFVKQKIKS